MIIIILKTYLLLVSEKSFSKFAEWFIDCLSPPTLILRKNDGDFRPVQKLFFLDTCKLLILRQ
jgi:hypothetical protein